MGKQDKATDATRTGAVMKRKATKARAEDKAVDSSRADDVMNIRKATKMEKTNIAANLDSFNFRELCFICGEICSVQHERRKSVNRRRKFYHVTQDTEKKIKSAIGVIDNDVNKSLNSRLRLIDLVEKGAVYHLLCLGRFLRRATKSHETHGRSPNKDRAEKFSEVIKEMEQSDEDQFLLNDLYAKMGEYALSKAYFKKKVLKHFGDDIIISTLPSVKTVVTLRNKLDKILIQHYKSKVMDSSVNKC